MLTSLVVLATFTFVLLKFLPGSPFHQEASLHPDIQAQLETQWKLSESAFHQWVSYISNVFQGDLGYSMNSSNLKVSDIIVQNFGYTLKLNLLALVIVIILSVGLSVVAVRFRGTKWEILFDQFFIAGVSLPSLFWGPLVIYFLAYKFELFPLAFLESPWHYVLPLLTLCLRPICVLSRFLKNSMSENQQADYVRTAVAKGMGVWSILIKHVLRNSWIPFLSYLGPLSVSLISGSFLVELLFAIPGLGTIFITALSERDHTLIMGLTLFYGFLLIFVNMFIDLLIKVSDPRFREVQ